jgi:HAD superfamily hydrolase (TIGR01509 family)
MKTPVAAIKGVIFDLDGTLVSSALNFSLIKAQIGCPCEQDLLDYIAQLPALSLRDQAMAIVHQHELHDAQQATMLPGVNEAVTALKAKNIPMAIVTRNCSQAAAIKLQQNSLPIEVVLTRSDAPAKPNPSALNTIATLWNISPSNLIYVGDFLYDIQAAHNANMRACLYVAETMPAYAEQADYILHDFSELVDLVEQHSEI